MDDVGGTITERRLIRARRIWIEEAKERRVGGGTGGRMRSGGRHWETADNDGYGYGNLGGDDEDLFPSTPVGVHAPSEHGDATGRHKWCSNRRLPKGARAVHCACDCREGALRA